METIWKQHGNNLETTWKQSGNNQKNEHEKFVLVLNACVSKAVLHFYVPAQTQFPATLFWPIAA